MTVRMAPQGAVRGEMSMGKSYESLTSVEEALDIIVRSVRSLPQETVSLFDAEGRVLSSDIIATTEIPPFHNSAMDGYALRALDTHGALRDKPAHLTVIGELQAGAFDFEKALGEGDAVRIMTGAPIPQGADAVVQFEDTEERDGVVMVYRQVAKNENIRFAGEDISKNSKILSAGDIIRPADMGLLASQNIADVAVHRAPEVAIISTGDEIVDIGQPMRPGQIRNSNAYTLYSEVRRCRAKPRYLGITGDSKAHTVEMLRDAMSSSVILTTGGVSMGKYDYVKDAVRELGFSILVENIRMKPGKPCVFGKKDDILFFGLPGNPVSTMVSFLQFVRPALLRCMGATHLEKPMLDAVLENDIKKKRGRKHFIRGFYTIRDGRCHVTTTGPQGSGILKSMSIANCLIIIPEDQGDVPAGSMVTIQLIRHEEM